MRATRSAALIAKSPSTLVFMALTINISLRNYDRLSDRCEHLTQAYSVLKSGVLVRRPKDDHFERVIEIHCSEDEAKALIALAKSVCREAIPEIEKSINTLREL